MSTDYLLSIEIEGKTNDIYVDVEYYIEEAQKGNLWQEEIKESVNIESVCYGETDITELLDNAQIKAIEKDILEKEVDYS